MRVQISLGSTIDEITNVSSNGLSILYTNGDVCEHPMGIRTYSSKITFICDMTSIKNESYDKD